MWCAQQLEWWRGRLARERGETPPLEDQDLKLARDALEYLDEASFADAEARSPEDKGPAGRALRGLPGQRLRLSLGGGRLFEVLDPERLDQKALEVVKSPPNRNWPTGRWPPTRISLADGETCRAPAASGREAGGPSGQRARSPDGLQPRLFLTGRAGGRRQAGTLVRLSPSR